MDIIYILLHQIGDTNLRHNHIVWRWKNKYDIIWWNTINYSFFLSHRPVYGKESYVN